MGALTRRGEETMGRISARSIQEPHLTGILTSQLPSLQTSDRVSWAASSPSAPGLTSCCPKDILPVASCDAALSLQASYVSSFLQNHRATKAQRGPPRHLA